MPQSEHTTTCPKCGATTPQDALQCPACGTPLKKVAWYKNLTPTELFLLVLGGIMLMIAVVAL